MTTPEVAPSLLALMVNDPADPVLSRAERRAVSHATKLGRVSNASTEVNRREYRRRMATKR